MAQAENLRLFKEQMEEDGTGTVGVAWENPDKGGIPYSQQQPAKEGQNLEA
ncbi:MAG: hypothetical protein OXE17_16115 [Chloroflexi bacterium]|nr:hypothetical protein [Chloroflexota bacterium]